MEKINSLESQVKPLVYEIHNLNHREIVGIEAGNSIPAEMHLFNSNKSGKNWVRAGNSSMHFDIDTDRASSDIIITHLSFDINGLFETANSYHAIGNMLQNFYDCTRLIIKESDRVLLDIPLETIANRIPKMNEDKDVQWLDTQKVHTKLQAPIVVPRHDTRKFQMYIEPLDGLKVPAAVEAANQNAPENLNLYNTFLPGTLVPTIGTSLIVGIEGYRLEGPEGSAADFIRRYLKKNQK